jgi:hypothetical protein
MTEEAGRLGNTSPYVDTGAREFWYENAIPIRRLSPVVSCILSYSPPLCLPSPPVPLKYISDNRKIFVYLERGKPRF